MFTKSALFATFTAIILNTTQGASAMSYQVEMQDVPAQTALVIKGKVKVDQAGEAIDGILGRIGAYLGRQGQNPTGAPFTRTYSHQDGMLEFEAGFPVAASVKGGDDIIRTELPKGKVAVTTHFGSQDTSPEAYKALHVWMTKNSKKEAGAPWEMYISPEGTPEKDAEMQIFYPVR
jgi:effector-binding domain-containing protein